jgi:hypothetical protein
MCLEKSVICHTALTPIPWRQSLTLRALRRPSGPRRGREARDVALTRSARYLSLPQSVLLPRAAQHHRLAEPMQLMLLRHNDDAMRQYARDRDADAHSDHACSLPHSPRFWATQRRSRSPSRPSSRSPKSSLRLSCSTSRYVRRRSPPLTQLGIESHADIFFG